MAGPPNRPQPPRTVGDFFSPFYRVAFLGGTADEGRFLDEAGNENFQSIAPSGVTFDSRELSFYASSLSIDYKGGAPAEFTLMLSPPYEDAIKIIDNRAIQWGTLVKVQWGYTSAMSSKNRLSKVHLFVCNKPQLAMTGNDITITLHGNDVLSDVFLRNQHRQQWDRNTFGTDLAIVHELASRLGNLKVDEARVPPDSLIRQVKTDSPAQIANDWYFLTELCETNLVGCHVEGDTLILYDMTSVTTQRASYNLLWRRAPRTDRDIPLMSFVGNADMRAFMPPEAISILDITTDTNSGETRARQFTPPQVSGTPHIGSDPTAPSAAGQSMNNGQTVTDQQSGANLITRLRQRADDTGVILPRPAHVNNSDHLAEGLARDAEFWANTKAMATAPGFPDLLPMQIVQVFGCGKSFDGPYLVLGTRHDLSTDGYTMQLELIRNIDPVASGETPVNPATSPVVGPTTETPVAAE